MNDIQKMLDAATIYSDAKRADDQGKAQDAMMEFQRALEAFVKKTMKDQAKNDEFTKRFKT